jgi:hypothetical protein
MPIPPREPREYMRPENEEARHEDGLPQTQTQTSPSVAEPERPPAQNFERVPRAIGRELGKGDLDSSEFLVLCTVAVTYDFLTGELITSLAGLADTIGWGHSHEYLRQTLKSLSEKGWIDYVTRRGQGAKYTIALGPMWWRALEEGTRFQSPHQVNYILNSNSAPPSQFELNSNSLPRELPASTDEQREETTPSIPTDLSSIEVDVEVEEEEDLSTEVIEANRSNATSPRDGVA